MHRTGAHRGQAHQRGVKGVGAFSRVLFEQVEQERIGWLEKEQCIRFEGLQLFDEKVVGLESVEGREKLIARCDGV